MLDPKSPILSALYQRHPDEAERLADAAASLTVWEAAALGRDEAVQAALRGDPSAVNAFAADGHTPLGLASFFARPSTVRLLLERGADVHIAARNDMKVQPLHAAIAGRSTEVVSALLAHRPDVNARQQAGYTPLMGAAAANNDEMVNLLLARGADPTLVSEDGKTAVTVARDHGFEALAARLEGLNRSETGR